MNKKDISGKEDIQLFVDEFYKKVRKDDLLAFVFAGRVQDWQSHLNRMYLFWNAALLGEKGYIGNPFSKHIALDITEKHFERWLTLFAETMDNYFEGPLAQDAIWRAGIMAENFLRRLYDIRHTGIKPIM